MRFLFKRCLKIFERASRVSDVSLGENENLSRFSTFGSGDFMCVSHCFNFLRYRASVTFESLNL